MRAASSLLVATLSLAAVVALPGGQSEARRADTRAPRAARKAHGRLDEALDKRGLAFGDDVFIRIFKEEAQLEVWMRPTRGEKFQLLKTYA